MNSTSAPISTETSTDRNPAEARHSADSAPGVFLMTNSFERGGSERQFVELACALQPENFKVSLGCIQTKGPFRDAVGAVECFPLGGSLYRWQSIRTRYRLAGYLRRNQIAVAHAFDYYTNLTLIPAAKLARTAVVIGSQRQLGDLLTPMQERAQTMMFRWADCVVCNSQAAADRLLQNRFPADRIAVIGNGLPPRAFAAATPALPRYPGVFRVGMIARMNALSKNHALLLEVAARLRVRMKDFEIVLVGDGPLRPELERKAKELGVQDVVQFLGDRQDVQAILASLDVTVLPSASESLSNAILESLAAGVPVIANRLGGNGELLSDDRGVLVPPNDVDAMTAALQRLAADDSLRHALGRNARAFALDNFTIERMRSRHEDLYRRLLEKRGWRSSVRAGTTS
jgi:L-malate glycosyltransferase